MLLWQSGRSQQALNLPLLETTLVRIQQGAPYMAKNKGNRKNNGNPLLYFKDVVLRSWNTVSNAETMGLGYQPMNRLQRPEPLIINIKGGLGGQNVDITFQASQCAGNLDNILNDARDNNMEPFTMTLNKL